MYRLGNQAQFLPALREALKSLTFVDSIRYGPTVWPFDVECTGNIGENCDRCALSVFASVMFTDIVKIRNFRSNHCIQGHDESQMFCRCDAVANRACWISVERAYTAHDR